MKLFKNNIFETLSQHNVDFCSIFLLFSSTFVKKNYCHKFDRHCLNFQISWFCKVRQICFRCITVAVTLLQRYETVFIPNFAARKYFNSRNWGNIFCNGKFNLFYISGALFVDTFGQPLIQLFFKFTCWNHIKPPSQNWKMINKTVDWLKF